MLLLAMLRAAPKFWGPGSGSFIVPVVVLTCSAMRSPEVEARDIVVLVRNLVALAAPSAVLHQRLRTLTRRLVSFFFTRERASI